MPRKMYMNLSGINNFNSSLAQSFYSRQSQQSVLINNSLRWNLLSRLNNSAKCGSCGK